jgi:hypothetical protein
MVEAARSQFKTLGSLPEDRFHADAFVPSGQFDHAEPETVPAE